MEIVPFNRPYSSPAAVGAISDAVERGHLSGDGHYTHLASRRLQEISKVSKAFLTTSCTHALEICSLLLKLEPGDEIIMPSFTFVSTANAFALRGARPVFVDIRPDTFNIDERKIESAITSRTRAVVVVHYAGVSCDMDEIIAIARRQNLVVIEDNAHGFGGTYRDKPLGSIGDLATLSFHETKNIQCGEGGALLINSDLWTEKAEIIREKGTNRSRFFRGEVDKYTWVDIGSSYLPSDILAAYLWTQLEEFDAIQSRRMHIWNRYRSELANWADQAGFEFQVVPEYSVHPAHIFCLLAPDLEVRTRFISHLADSNVNAVFHYVPLHASPAGRDFGDKSLPITESVSERLVRLPLYPELQNDLVDQVVRAVTSF